MIPYRQILLATDFSDTARDALDHAVGIAEEANATLHLLHVVEEVGYWEGFDLKRFPSDDVYEELRESARIALDDLVERTADRDVEHRVEVREGKPFLEIIRAAKEIPADLIVVGSHGQSGLAETLFGSTAEKVVRKAPCAVLVVRHPEHTFAMP
ncbi:MAG: universal stress protein [Gemmatimonadota bacterium]|nr:universal stress protein [Gemmatimonadota bacterium]